MKIPPQIKKLYTAAKKVRKNAYAPYSRHKVGAAIQSGAKIYTGCNVENAAFLTRCAEQVAIVKAVSEGKQKFSSLLVVTPAGIGPCGACLQYISEFCSPEMNIWLATPKKIVGPKKVKELFSGSVGPKHLLSKK